MTQVRLATPDECVTLFGYRPGTVPPLGRWCFAVYRAVRLDRSATSRAS